LRENIVVDWVYENYEVGIQSRKLLANLIELPILEFDIILGMDWLSCHWVTIDYRKKKVEFRQDNQKTFIFQREMNK